MSDMVDIPIISRGRILMPGEGAVEFKGRGGARFRTPDPHKHIHDLVLGNPALLSDLNNSKMHDIVESLLRSVSACAWRRIAICRSHLLWLFEPEVWPSPSCAASTQIYLACLTGVC
jgi:hypothetical protein